jgi:TPR repeat protein
MEEHVASTGGAAATASLRDDANRRAKILLTPRKPVATTSKAAPPGPRDKSNAAPPPRDKQLAAIEIMMDRAAHGQASAQVVLGKLYYRGDGASGVAHDLHEASRLIRAAAEQGNVDALASLGYLYCRGHGVPQSFEEAEYCWRTSGDKGHAASQRAWVDLFTNHGW